MPQTHTYSPTAEQPYQPYESQQPTPAAPPIAAAQEPGFKFTGAPNTTLGNVAGALDNIFRGYMRGRAEGQAKQVMQLKAKTDNLQNSYNQDASLLYQMAQSGVDPNSEEYKKAMSAVQGSWGALQDWEGQHVNQDDGKKKKSKSKAGDQQQSDPLTDLRSEDPNVKAKALFQLRQKMGPPVLWQVKQLQTPEAIAARKAQTQGAENQAGAQDIEAKKQTAEQDRIAILQVPEDQRTDAQKKKLESAESILTPPAKVGTEYDQSRATIARKVAEDPNYTLTDSEKAILAGGKPTYPKPPGSAASLKPGTFGFALTDKYGPHPTYDQYMAARRQEAQSRHVSSGSGGAGGADKTYNKWHTYYKEHYPGMGDDELDSLTRRKVEGAGQLQAGQVGFDAATQPEQFDSDVISQAIDNVRKLPQYGGQNPSLKYFDDALANIVGLGDNGYQYHPKSYIQEHGPDSSGKFAGDVSQDQLKNLERDLQTQIRVILSKQTGLPPDQKRAAGQRMAPLFGPAAQYGPEPAVPRSGTPPASPPAAAATHPAPASSPGSGGHKGPSKGTVKKSAFLKANPGSTDADWKAIQPQLQQQGYDTKDE